MLFLTFRSAFIFASKDKNTSKVTHSMLRIIFSDDLAKNYNKLKEKEKCIKQFKNQ